MNIQKIKKGFLMAFVAGLVFVGPRLAEASTLKATSNVNIRSGAYNTATKIAYAYAGDSVTYLGTSGSWYKVEINGVVGYTYNPYWRAEMITATANVNIRESANATSTKVGYVLKGNDATVIARTGDWLYIEYQNIKGYSHKNYWNLPLAAFNKLPLVSSLPVEPTPIPEPTPQPTPIPESTPAPTLVGERVVAEARKLIGAKYVYGGESWSEGGFDCSGLTQFVYKQVGISIPRTASQQWAGIKTKVTNPLPGDIIAFERTDGSVYHVGIYIGNNKMIHSPKPGEYVKEVTLDWYYKNNKVKGFLRP